MKKKFDRIIIRLKYFFNYILANYFLKRKVDAGNNNFNIMSDEELIDKIVNKKMSFSRFGDGELSLILDSKFNLSFQTNSSAIQKELTNVLNSNIDNLIVGISVSLNNPSIYSKKIQKYYRTFNFMNRDNYKRIIPSNKIYGNASITRFYMDYDHSDLDAAYERLNNLKKIWNNKKILIVEGDKSKLGVGNDLFYNTKRVRRILVPTTNAFDQLDKIVEEVQEKVESDEVVLLAVGPTATILAYRLAKSNIQSIDIGHIDIEYEWLKMRADKRVIIKGKYVNEVKGKKYIESDQVDKKYNKSIISIIK